MRRHRSDMFPSVVFATVVLVLITAPTVVDSILCYQCATIEDNHECVTDHSGLMNTSLGITDKYFKDCTSANENWTRCMIMTAERTAHRFFHRGCHDGVTFSDTNTHKRFENLPANNQTTCARINDQFRELVCFTFCDTDFCNGPQPPPRKVDPCESLNSTDISYTELGCGATALKGAITLAVTQVCVVLLLLGLFS